MTESRFSSDCRTVLARFVLVSAIAAAVSLSGTMHARAAGAPAQRPLGTLYPTAEAGTYAGAPQVSDGGALVTQLTYTPGVAVPATTSAPPAATQPGASPDGIAMASSVTTYERSAGLADSSSYTYTPSHKSFKASNNDGTFAAQVPFPTIRLNWGWNFSALVKGTALSPVKEFASLYSWPKGRHLNYSDDHTYIASATFHSSVPSHLNQGYQLAINFSWRCYGPAGPGSCLLYVRHYYHIQKF
jgi:hypothetical protein